MTFTGNDVTDYSQFFNGKDEPPRFYREYFDLQHKIFIPNDDVSLAEKLEINTKQNGILHYFSYDKKQNGLIVNPFKDKKLHSKFYAVCTPDFSVDSASCFSCFNESNILKARINATLWQEKCEEPAILTLIWGDETTYRYAFENVERGTVCAVSHQGIKDEQTFKDGLKKAVDTIQMEKLCWLGNIPEYIKGFYDLNRIIRIQTRNELLQKLMKKHSAEEEGKTSMILFQDD